jgi:GH24 family phage-related lysozyme (muramidase)
MNPKTKPYAEMLQSGLDNGNQQMRNSAVFALQSNPQTREILNNEVSDYINKQTSANKNVDFSSREGRSPQSESMTPEQSNYLSTRNRFILEQESGPGAYKKSSFAAYDDGVGNRTIGHGFNMDAPGHLDVMKNVLGLSDDEVRSIYNGETRINKQQAEKLFNTSINKAERQLDKKLASVDSNIQLTPKQRIALVSAIYNSPKLIGPKILSALKTGNYDDVAAMLSTMSDHQANEAPGLPIRRRKEAGLFSSND